jgi:hypothetical protein
MLVIGFMWTALRSDAPAICRCHLRAARAKFKVRQLRRWRLKGARRVRGVSQAFRDGGKSQATSPPAGGRCRSWVTRHTVPNPCVARGVTHVYTRINAGAIIPVLLAGTAAVMLQTAWTDFMYNVYTPADSHHTAPASLCVTNQRRRSLWRPACCSSALSPRLPSPALSWPQPPAPWYLWPPWP